MTENEKLAFETRAIHVGSEPDGASGAVIPPISLSTTFRQTAVGEHLGYEYSRQANPSREGLESCLASLEGAKHGFAYASGLAAEDAILRLLSPGDHVVLGDDAYGGTYRLIAKIFNRVGITWSAADLTNPDILASVLQSSTKLVWIETPTNPALRIIDVAAIVEVAHARSVRIVVDNTFATPYLQQPLELGADFVVYSSTKYLGGHSDLVGGFVALNEDETANEMRLMQYAIGAVPSPFDCYLLLRSLKTLALRMERHCSNAQEVVNMLVEQPKVANVYYPFLDSHPNVEIARKQMFGGGGMVSFTMTGGKEAALGLVAKTKLFTLAESLGAVESLIDYPALMTHSSAEDSPLAVDPALVRLSVGIEDVSDLLNDLDKAFQSLS